MTPTAKLLVASTTGFFLCLPLLIITNVYLPKKAEASTPPPSSTAAPLYVGTVNCGAYDVLVIPHDDASTEDAREAVDNYRCPENLGTR